MCIFGASIIHVVLNKSLIMCQAYLGVERDHFQPLFLLAGICTIKIVNIYFMSRFRFNSISGDM